MSHYNADGSVTASDLKADAHAELVDELLAQADWRRADQRQPPLYAPVLTYDESADEQVWLGWLTPTGWHVVDGASAPNVTHWAPRPNAPTER